MKKMTQDSVQVRVIWIFRPLGPGAGRAKGQVGHWAGDAEEATRGRWESRCPIRIRHDMIQHTASDSFNVHSGTPLPACIGLYYDYIMTVRQRVSPLRA